MSELSLVFTPSCLVASKPLFGGPKQGPVVQRLPQKARQMSTVEILDLHSQLNDLSLACQNEYNSLTSQYFSGDSYVLNNILNCDSL